MKLPRIRITVRRLMVLVAIVALSIWSREVAIRWTVYHAQVVRCEESLEVLKSEMMAIRKEGGRDGEVVRYEEAIVRMNREAEHYRRLMRRAWLSGRSDPPEPK
jgi:predicted nucleic acid-binding protein